MLKQFTKPTLVTYLVINDFKNLKKFNEFKKKLHFDTLLLAYFK